MGAGICGVLQSSFLSEIAETYILTDTAFLFDSLFSHNSSDFLILCGTGAVRVSSSVSAPHY